MVRAKAPDSPPPDWTNSVQGMVRLYDCPSTDAVDTFLVELADRISRAAKLPKLIAQYRADQDALLDRRLWLEMTRSAPDIGEINASVAAPESAPDEVRKVARRPLRAPGGTQGS